MTDETLDVWLNLEENYRGDGDHPGTIRRSINPVERETYLNGTFEQLIGYVLKDRTGLDEEQQVVYDMAKERIENNSGSSAVVIRFYDHHGRMLQGDLSPGQAYLDTIVRHNIADEAPLINMGIYSLSSVG